MPTPLFLLVALLATPPAAPYAGRWTLDQPASRGLPDYYARVRRHALAIAQSDSALDVRVVVDIDAASDTLRFPYRLDGRVVETETPIRTAGGPRPVPTSLQAAVRADGTVHVVITRAFAMGGEAIRATTTEDWRLDDGGRTLVVHRVDDSPRGRAESDFVFRRE